MSQKPITVYSFVIIIKKKKNKKQRVGYNKKWQLMIN